MAGARGRARAMSFVHLHTHSEYSLLDGANRISSLIKRAKEYEMPALALTDHGCMYGIWEFQQKAARQGLRAIAGMEAYVAPGDRRERRVAEKGERSYYHLVLLARDLEGYRNLIKLTSIGYLEGFYHRPRIDREVLARHSGGLIVSSACLAGEVARHLMANDWAGARESATWYANTFPDRYYLEVQAHDTEGQAGLNRKIFQLAGEMGVPVVATNDAHFSAQTTTRRTTSCSASGWARTGATATGCATMRGSTSRARRRSPSASPSIRKS